MCSPERLAREAPEQRERRLAKARAYIKANPDKAAKARAKWAAAHPEYPRAYYDSRAAEVKARAAAWKRANRQRARENNRRWEKANPEKAAAAAKVYKARKRREPGYRLSSSVSTQMRQCLANGKAGRKWEALVGYTIADLVPHLERQFLPGMSWANYGVWHIDHRRPISSFAFTCAEDQDFITCWALSNLQPLWAEDNLTKGARYDGAA